MRKFISQKNPKQFKNDENIPFNSWDCITLQIRGQADVYLVIKNEKIMTMFLKLLIYHLKTLDGTRDTAVKVINLIFKSRLQEKLTELGKTQRWGMDRIKNKIMNQVRHEVMLRTLTRYTILRVK